MAQLDGTDDVFDSREVIERIAELEALAMNDDGEIDATLLDDDDAEEYAALDELRNDAEGYVADWAYGETFISEDHFTEYAKELTEDVGYIPADLPEWIKDNIDWDGVADALKVDYEEFEFHGTTYYAR